MCICTCVTPPRAPHSHCPPALLPPPLKPHTAPSSVRICPSLTSPRAGSKQMCVFETTSAGAPGSPLSLLPLSLLLSVGRSLTTSATFSPRPSWQKSMSWRSISDARDVCGRA
eukprot:152424-Chlamydomonas_euryale.AAC.1